MKGKKKKDNQHEDDFDQEEEPMHEAEKTVDIRTINGEKQCKVKWMGRTCAHNSWDLCEHMTKIVPESVEVFE